jgi:ABC-type glycerol-3-phosphate transport system substrate-binding protein
MFADSEQKEAAWKFIEFLATDPGAIKAYTIGTNRSLPPLAKINDPELKAQLDTPVFQAFSEKIIPTIAPQPYGPAFASAATAVMAGVQQAVTGNEPIDDIASSIQQQLNR